MFLFMFILPILFFMLTVALGIMVAAFVPDKVIRKVLSWIEK